MGILLLLAGGQNALAICTPINGILDATFAPPATITVNRTAAVGDVLYRSTSLSTPSATIRCNSITMLAEAGYLASMQVVPGMTRVYQTNIPGIGVKVLATHALNENALKADGWTAMARYTYEGDDMTMPMGYADHLVRSGVFRVEFILTGHPVSPGQLSLPSPLAGFYSSDSDPNPALNRVLYARLLASGTTQVVARGCAVNKNNISVSLPTISVSHLNGVGATAGVTPFTIPLTCYPFPKVTYQINGTSPIGMAASLGVLANRTNAGDATGVGVQILRGRNVDITPIALNTRATISANVGDYRSVSIPFAARYYRTSSRMTGGTVWAQATFTMNYE